jgi:hypothetical protein
VPVIENLGMKEINKKRKEIPKLGGAKREFPGSFAGGCAALYFFLGIL